jgi:hypothetical protein
MAGAPLLDKTYTESDLNSEFDILGPNYEWKEEDFYRRFFTGQVGSALSGNEQKACVIGAFTPPNLSLIRGRNGETDPDLFR